MKKKLLKGCENLEQLNNETKISKQEKWEEKQVENKGLTIIPKAERYIQYMLDLILKLPRTEKFSIGTEYKTSLYEMMNNIIYLRIMKNNRWIDENP